MNTLRKYSWQLVSTLLALITIFATYNVFFLSKPNKEIQVIVERPVSLVDVKPEAIQDIQVSYKGEPVNKVYLLQIQIVNAGNLPIADTDYSRPISFTFSPKYKLADATVTSSEPARIGMSVSKTSEQTALVSETLLNPGDKVSVSFILIGNDNDTEPNKFDIDGRILGVKEIKQVSPSEKDSPGLLAVAAAIGAIANLLANLFGERIIGFLRKRKNKGTSSIERKAG